MVNDSKSILKIVSDFKSKKWSTSKIEIELGISNGLLGKAAKGKTKLSDEKFSNLLSYHIKNFAGNLSAKITTADKIKAPESKTMLDRIIEDDKKTAWVKQIEYFCNQEGILPLDLIEVYKTKKTAKVLPTKIEENKFHDFTMDKSYAKPYNPFDNPIYKAKMASNSKFKKE